jgi:hypothetical protein
VEVAVDKGRRDETPAAVDPLPGDRCERRPQLGDAPVLDADVDAGAAIGEGGVGEKKVEGHQRHPSGEGCRREATSKLSCTIFPNSAHFFHDGCA